MNRKDCIVRCSKRDSGAFRFSIRSGRLIEEAEEPERNFVVATYIGIVFDVDGVGRRANAARLIADADVRRIVNAEHAGAVALIDRMVAPEAVDEVSLHDILLLHVAFVDGIHEVGVVEVNRSRLLRVAFAFAVNHIDKACLLEILEVVHDRRSRSADFLSQAADIGRRGVAYSQEVKELLDAGEILQLDLLIEQKVYLNHVVHRLQKRLGKVMVLEEEGIIAMLEVFLEVMPRLHLRQYRTEDAVMIGQELVESISLEVLVGDEVDVLAEGKAVEHVDAADMGKFRIVLSFAHIDGGRRINDAKVGIFMVALHKLLAPVGQLKRLIDQEYLTALGNEASGKVYDAVSLEVETVEIDVETLAQAHIEVFLRILQKKRSSSNATRALDAYHAIAPVDGIH